MITKAFALYDTKAGLFHVPFFFPHMGQAIRACIDLAGDLSTIVGRHPSDFALYEIGLYDDATGTFSATNPANLGLVSSFLPAQPAFAMASPADLASTISQPNGAADHLANGR